MFDKIQTILMMKTSISNNRISWLNNKYIRKRPQLIEWHHKIVLVFVLFWQNCKSLMELFHFYFWPSIYLLWCQLQPSIETQRPLTNRKAYLGSNQIRTAQFFWWKVFFDSRSIFRTQSNIYVGDFLRKKLTALKFSETLISTCESFEKPWDFFSSSGIILKNFMPNCFYCKSPPFKVRFQEELIPRIITRTSNSNVLQINCF